MSLYSLLTVVSAASFAFADTDLSNRLSSSEEAKYEHQRVKGWSSNDEWATRKYDEPHNRRYEEPNGWPTMEPIAKYAREPRHNNMNYRPNGHGTAYSMHQSYGDHDGMNNKHYPSAKSNDEPTKYGHKYPTKRPKYTKPTQKPYKKTDKPSKWTSTTDYPTTTTAHPTTSTAHPTTTTAHPTTTTAHPTTTTRYPTTSTAHPTTDYPTSYPTTGRPTTTHPTTAKPTTYPTEGPTLYPTENPTTKAPTTAHPTTAYPTADPTTKSPTTQYPTTMKPTTEYPTTMKPTTAYPTTVKPTTSYPTTTTAHPTTVQPTTTTKYPTTSTAHPTTTTASAHVYPSQKPSRMNWPTVKPTHEPKGYPSKEPQMKWPTMKPIHQPKHYDGKTKHEQPSSKWSKEQPQHSKRRLVEVSTDKWYGSQVGEYRNPSASIPTDDNDYIYKVCVNSDEFVNALSFWSRNEQVKTRYAVTPKYGGPGGVRNCYQVPDDSCINMVRLFSDGDRINGIHFCSRTGGWDAEDTRNQIDCHHFGGMTGELFTDYIPRWTFNGVMTCLKTAELYFGKGENDGINGIKFHYHSRVDDLFD